MTVIAYRDGVFAFDSGVIDDNGYIANVEKVVPYGDWVFCVTGTITPTHCIDLVDSSEDFEVPVTNMRLGDIDPNCLEREEGGIAVLYHKPSNEFYICNSGSYPVKMSSLSRDGNFFWAIGAEKNLALGAMAAGATAIEAVDIAIKYGLLAKGETRVYRVKDDNVWK